MEHLRMRNRDELDADEIEAAADDVNELKLGITEVFEFSEPNPQSLVSYPETENSTNRYETTE
jgi:hypothetical protein